MRVNLSYNLCKQMLYFFTRYVILSITIDNTHSRPFCFTHNIIEYKRTVAFKTPMGYRTDKTDADERFVPLQRSVS